MRFFWIVIRSMAVSYIIIGAYLFTFQRDLIYFPTAEENHPYFTEKMAIDGEILNIVTLNRGKSDAILYFGGVGEPVVKNGPDFAKTFPHHTIYFVNYRGYGGSSGAPSEHALYSDAADIYDRVSPRHESLSVIGRSLGTGVATYLASMKPIAKLVLITPYDSVEHIAQDSYPIFPMWLILKDKFNSLAQVRKVTAATLVILAEHDLMIPAKYSSHLIRAFPTAQVMVETIKGTGHNNLHEKARYHSLLGNFL
ncbi:alpha/beta hydrolase [Paremcibacter congregatus]|uniref:alpha/beta hydrolase n=1 Tax=Paremcibacter congregatus TaxID=2043170 RepID=UPI0030EF93C5